MEFLRNGTKVKLYSYHLTYLHAGMDKISVILDKNGTCETARWTVEFVPSSHRNSNIRLKSCYGNYLTASDLPLMLGWTGRIVLLTPPVDIDSYIDFESTYGYYFAYESDSHGKAFNGKQHLNSTVEWELDFIDRNRVRLKNRYGGSFLRANGGMPPWMNTVTHQTENADFNNDWNWHFQIEEQRHDQSPVESGSRQQEQNQRPTPAPAPAPTFRQRDAKPRVAARFLICCVAFLLAYLLQQLIHMLEYIGGYFTS